MKMTIDTHQHSPPVVHSFSCLMVYLHSESCDSSWVQRWVLLVFSVHQSVMGNRTIGLFWFTPLQMSWVRTCQWAQYEGEVGATHRSTSLKWYQHNMTLTVVPNWTHQWAWQREVAYSAALPAKFEQKPTDSKLSLGSCGLGLGTENSWKVVGLGWHQKIPVAHWTI